MEEKRQKTNNKLLKKKRGALNKIYGEREREKERELHIREREREERREKRV